MNWSEEKIKWAEKEKAWEVLKTNFFSEEHGKGKNKVKQH